MVAPSLVTEMVQVVVPLPHNRAFAPVAPSKLPLSLEKVHAPAEPPKVNGNAPVGTVVIVDLSEEKVADTFSI